MGLRGSVGHTLPLLESDFEVSRIQGWKSQGAGHRLQEGNLGLVMFLSTGNSSIAITEPSSPETR